MAINGGMNTELAQNNYLKTVDFHQTFVKCCGTK